MSIWFPPVNLIHISTNVHLHFQSWLREYVRIRFPWPSLSTAQLCLRLLFCSSANLKSSKIRQVKVQLSCLKPKAKLAKQKAAMSPRCRMEFWGSLAPQKKTSPMAACESPNGASPRMMAIFAWKNSRTSEVVILQWSQSNQRSKQLQTSQPSISFNFLIYCTPKQVIGKWIQHLQKLYISTSWRQMYM